MHGRNVPGGIILLSRSASVCYHLNHPQHTGRTELQRTAHLATLHPAPYPAHPSPPSLVSDRHLSRASLNLPDRKPVTQKTRIC
jgi:hypothetical protein